MDYKLRLWAGYTFVEVIVVIIIIGILAAVASKTIGSATETARFEKTREIMDNLAYALAGNPALASGGVRTDFGYIGDVGSLPSDWNDLITNPGGFATWKGPYLKDKFSAGGAAVYFNLDAWGKAISDPSSSFSSTGGPQTITRQIAVSVNDLLYNRVTVIATDLGFTPPGAAYKDSIRIVLTYPDGLGGYRVRTIAPDANGRAVFDSIPIGIHTLQMVYIPDHDTLTRKININPGHNYYAEMQYYSDLW